MVRKSILALGLMASACAPAPMPMSAAQAGEVLERFAAGAASGDVCTPRGRALLRGAVRAYSAEMRAAGVAWPAVGGNQVRSVDVSVVVALAAGFVEASDFRGPVRLAERMSLARLPELYEMRRAARVACAEAAQLQNTAARFMLEAERYRGLTLHALKHGEALVQLNRQERRLERAQAQMEVSAAQLEAAVRAARAG